MNSNQRKAAEKAIESVTDGRILALAAFFAVLATLGLGLPVVLGLLAALGTVATAAAVNAAPALRRDRAEAIGARPEVPELVAHTQQAQVVTQIAGTLDRIRQLRDGGTLAESVQDSAAQAYASAKSALETANKVATGVDQLDSAMRELQNVRAASDSLERLGARRAVMLERLNRTLGGVVDVYGKLVETNATVNTSSIIEAGDQDQLRQIGSSLDDLRLIVGELEQDTGHQLPPQAS
ncbi:MAG: hypothetical protein JWM93_3467 [Frankiales bacterium]|nr:hypothetical protein [Frankiales bacterium]